MEIKRFLHILASWLLAVIMASTLHIGHVNASQEAKPAKIAIILDDIGGKPSDINAFGLPTLVTFSILPNTDYSTRYSYLAANQDREVMLHMPMESLHGEKLGPYPLMSTMYPQEQIRNLTWALNNVPHAVGINNHMGSKLTQITLSMRTVMEVLAQKNLFFIDSLTTKFSRAHYIAEDFGVKYATRHIFLDHEKSEAFVTQQFERLISIAREQGVAIGIAHPYRLTLDILPKLIERLPKDVEMVTVNSLMSNNTNLIARDAVSEPQLQSLKFAPK